MIAYDFETFEVFQGGFEVIHEEIMKIDKSRTSEDL